MFLGAFWRPHLLSDSHFDKPPFLLLRMKKAPLKKRSACKTRGTVLYLKTKRTTAHKSGCLRVKLPLRVAYPVGRRVGIFITWSYGSKQAMPAGVVLLESKGITPRKDSCASPPSFLLEKEAATLFTVVLAKNHSIFCCMKQYGASSRRCAVLCLLLIWLCRGTTSLGLLELHHCVHDSPRNSDLHCPP